MILIKNKSLQAAITADNIIAKISKAARKTSIKILYVYTIDCSVLNYIQFQ